MTRFVGLVTLPGKAWHPDEGLDEDVLRAVLERWWVEREGEWRDHEAAAAVLGDLTGPERETAIRRYNAEKLDEIRYDAATGRHYVFTTYNPEGKWDWYDILRWEPALISVPTARWDDLIHGAPHSEEYHPATGGKWCSGGPVRFLDFDALRTHAAEEAAREFDQWQRICAETPTARSRAWFADLEAAGEMTAAEAHRRCAAQPRYRRASELRRVVRYLDEETGPDIGLDSLPDRATFIAQQQCLAFCFTIVVTLDGEWTEVPDWVPGADLASPRQAHLAAFGAATGRYLASVPPDTVLAVVLFHC